MPDTEWTDRAGAEEIVYEVLNLVKRASEQANSPIVFPPQPGEFEDVHGDELEGLLDEYMLDPVDESSGVRELNSEVEELLERMDTEDVLRALNREIALSESSGERTTKVDRWEEQIRNGEAELEDVEVGKVSEGADMSRTSFYKLKDRVEGSGED